MVVISDDVKTRLKRPLGKLYSDYSYIKKLGNKRVISIGDESTLVLLEHGIKPHLAVFDFKIKRKRISPSQKKKLLSSFSRVKKYRNPKGTVSERLINNAKKLVAEGGAVLIDGEEDLATLAFVICAGKNDAILYGQPDEGIVLVVPDKKMKSKIRRILSASSRTF